jgi:hypothetical protein
MDIAGNGVPQGADGNARPEGSNRLPIPIDEITAEDVACRKAAGDAVRHAVEAGQRLIEAKELVPHGSWLTWLGQNLPQISIRTAQRYMRAAEAVGKNDTVSFSSLRELIAPPKPAPQPWWREETDLPAWWRRYPQDLPHVVAYLHADGASREEIAAELHLPIDRIAAQFAEPVILPAGEDDVPLVEPLTIAVAEILAGSRMASALQAGLWANLYQRSDLAKILRRDESDSLAAAKHHRQRLEERYDEISVAVFLTAAFDLCREAWGCDPARDLTLWMRVGHAGLIQQALGADIERATKDVVQATHAFEVYAHVTGYWAERKQEVTP